MSEVRHKHFFIENSLELLQGYSTGENGGNFYDAHYRNEAIIVSTVPIRLSSKFLNVTELFSGTRLQFTNEIADKLLTASDTSDNPSRPFRWYKFAAYDCADTNNEEDMDRVRQVAITNMLAKIDTPETFFIYEIKVK